MYTKNNIKQAKNDQINTYFPTHHRQYTSRYSNQSAFDVALLNKYLFWKKA